MPFTQVFWQFHTGHTFISPLWFLFAQIVFVLCFALLFYITKPKASNIVLVVLAFFALALQYSGINYKLFGHLPWALKWPFGRLAETLPYCVIGFFMGKFNFYQKLQKKRYWVLVICIFAFIFTRNLNIPIGENFHYAGIVPIIRSFLFLTIFYFLPFDVVCKKFPKAPKIFSVITRYTLGIYCMHIIAGQYTEILFKHFDFSCTPLVKGLIIYFECYIFCFIVDIMPFKLCRSLVR